MLKLGDVVIFEDYYHNDLQTGIVVTTGRGGREGNFEVMASKRSLTGRPTLDPYTFWTDRDDLWSLDDWEEYGKEAYGELLR
ncbi:MAG: hypothetical protein CME70_18955 [Halobacteriovorax sp.]|nr:hypothetical protein [Halobacteriovorax sp.]|tara:strand:+ start:182 stop:427 length:246 start_codon:yes stop_codon:yes gene_type:complete